jgi:hypothetical protein
MTTRVTYDMCEETLTDAVAVGEFFADRADSIAPHGGRANAYWLGPPDADDELRADLDFDTGRAALRWLPDNSHAVELPEGGPIVVLESSNSPVATIPASLARVSIDTARRAILEYVLTGQRPICATWEPRSA